MFKLIYPEVVSVVQKSLQQLVHSGVLPAETPVQQVVVEQPRDLSHGDFATNAAMVLAKPAGIPPRRLAEQLVPVLQQQGADLFSAITVAGPGFINFNIIPKLLNRQLVAIVQQGENFACSNIGQGVCVNVEFCSANPTGPLHAGHIRGTVFGDALCHLLQKAGYRVQREYLINDAGNQIKVLVKTAHLRYLQLFGEQITIPEGCYPGDYMVDIAKKIKERDGDKWLHETNQAVLLQNLRGICVEAMMDDIKADLHDLRLPDYTCWFSEYAMHQTGLPEQVMQQLAEKGLVYTGTLPPPKGKVVDDYEACPLPLFKSSAFGDDTDRPMKNSHGEFTYFGADVAYHTTKLARGAHLLVNVWGADHGGAVKRLKSALEAITGQKGVLEIKLMQIVRFTKNGELVRMSKRAGNIVTLRQILDEVGPDAVRFWFLNRKPEAQFDFDVAKAIEQSNDNPVFYVHYAHARMCSIFRQQKEMGIAAISPEKVDVTLLVLPQEIELMQHLSLYPLEIEKAALAMEPHRIAFYAADLAARFHSWYNACKFLEPDNLPTTHARLLLVQAARLVLADALAVLGVSAPEKM